MAHLSIKIARDSAGFGIPVPIEVVNMRLETVKRGAVAPSSDTFRTELSTGDYMILATLPSGQTIQRKVHLTDRQEAVVHFSVSSPHEWLQWETLLGMVRPFSVTGAAVTAGEDQEECIVESYLRLWVKGHETWLGEPLPIHDQKFDGRVGRLSFDTASDKLQVLQVFGPRFVPSRFIALPPRERISVVYQPAERPSYYDGGVSVRVASHDPIVETMLRFLRYSDSQTQNSLAPVALETAEQTLRNKFERPSEALAAGYYLLRIGGYEYLHDWLRNFSDRFKHLPDPPVLFAWQCLRQRTDTVEAAAFWFLEGARRGIPIYTEGMQLLFDGLELMATSEDAPAKYREDARIELKRIRPYYEARRGQNIHTTFLGITPNEPSLEPSYQVPSFPDNDVIQFKIKANATEAELQTLAAPIRQPSRVTLAQPEMDTDDGSVDTVLVPKGIKFQFPPAKEKRAPKDTYYDNSPLLLLAGWFMHFARWFNEENIAYLVAFAASLMVYGVLRGHVASIHGINWVTDFLVVIPLLLVFAFKTLPRLIARHSERLLANISLRDIDSARPALGEDTYFHIGPYPESRRRRYDRADKAHEEVLSWLKGTNEPVVVLSGLSGTGKTSMLEAFVIPELHEGESPFKVLLIRGFDDPLSELRRQLLDPGLIWKKPGNDLADLALGEIIRRAVSRLRRDDPGTKLLAVLDQFEELVTLRENGYSSTIVEITDFLRKLQNSSIDGFLLLLALRSDYQTFLESLGVPPLDKSRNWREVPAFTYSAGSTFLTAPETGLRIHGGQLRRVLKAAVAADGTPGLVRPIILNMLGIVLQRIADSPEAERPTRDLLTDDLRAFIDHPRRRAIARAVLPHMLTDSNTKQPRRIGELCSATKLDARVIHGCLLELETSGYVHQITRPKQIVDGVWEISHDFVARLLGSILENPSLTFWQRVGLVFYPLRRPRQSSRLHRPTDRS